MENNIIASKMKPEKGPFKDIAIVKCPSIIGGSNTPEGLKEAPDYLINGGLKEVLENIGYGVHIFSVKIPSPSNTMKNGILNHAETLELTKKIAKVVGKQRSMGRFVISIGGDHAIDIGVIRGIKMGSPGELGVVVGDGHFDSNTPETSITGNVHGMVASTYMGKGDEDLTSIFSKKGNILPKNVFMWGIQTEIFDFFLSDHKEQENLEEWGVPFVTKPEIDRDGGSMKKVLKGITKLRKNVDQISFSLDMDVLDFNESPGVAMQNPDGITKSQLMEVVDHLSKNKDNGADLVGMSIVEIDPNNDDGRTKDIAIEVVSKILGKVNK